MRKVRVLLVLLTMAACTRKPPPPPRPMPAILIPPPPLPPGVPPPPSAQSGQTDPDCVGTFTHQGDEGDIKMGGHTFHRTGAMLTLVDPPTAPGIVFGVVADLQEPTAANLFNLNRYIEQFKAANVSVIMVAGDSGETKAEIAGTLEPLAGTGLPVLVIPGNREDKNAYRAAIAELAPKHPNLVDMTRIRLVRLRDVSVMSLPGYYDKHYLLHPDSGCLYTKEDVDRLASIEEAAMGPILLLAHAEPHGTGPQAIDAFQGGNAGDAYLTSFIKLHELHFGVSANIEEAGGRATDIDSKPIHEDEPVDSLYLNPGSADATPWHLNDGTMSHGSVATLTVKDGKASYKIYRVPPLTEAETTAAAKLVPAATKP